MPSPEAHTSHDIPIATSTARRTRGRRPNLRHPVAGRLGVRPQIDHIGRHGPFPNGRHVDGGTANEIDAARSVHLDGLNVQDQPKYVWPASVAVARAYLDQLVWNKGIARDRATAIGGALDQCQKMLG